MSRAQKKQSFIFNKKIRKRKEIEPAANWNSGPDWLRSKILAIDWFDAEIRVPGKRIGTNSQNVGHVNVANLNHVNFLKIN